MIKIRANQTTIGNNVTVTIPCQSHSMINVMKKRRHILTSCSNQDFYELKPGENWMMINPKLMECQFLDDFASFHELFVSSKNEMNGNEKTDPLSPTTPGRLEQLRSKGNAMICFDFIEDDDFVVLKLFAYSEDFQVQIVRGGQVTMKVTHRKMKKLQECDRLSVVWARDESKDGHESFHLVYSLRDLSKTMNKDDYINKSGGSTALEVDKDDDQSDVFISPMKPTHFNASSNNRSPIAVRDDSTLVSEALYLTANDEHNDEINIQKNAENDDDDFLHGPATQVYEDDDSSATASLDSEEEMKLAEDALKDDLDHPLFVSSVGVTSQIRNEKILENSSLERVKMKNTDESKEDEVVETAFEQSENCVDNMPANAYKSSSGKNGNIGTKLIPNIDGIHSGGLKSEENSSVAEGTQSKDVSQIDEKVLLHLNMKSLLGHDDHPLTYDPQKNRESIKNEKDNIAKCASNYVMKESTDEKQNKVLDQISTTNENSDIIKTRLRSNNCNSFTEKVNQTDTQENLLNIISACHDLPLTPVSKKRKIIKHEEELFPDSNGSFSLALASVSKRKGRAQERGKSEILSVDSRTSNRSQVKVLFTGVEVLPKFKKVCMLVMDY